MGHGHIPFLGSGHLPGGLYGCIRLADIWNIPYYRADTKRLSIVLMGKDAFRRFGMFILKKTSMIWRAADAQQFL
jgi:transcriptional regulator of nitric oxide reductase